MARQGGGPEPFAGAYGLAPIASLWREPEQARRLVKIK